MSLQLTDTQKLRADRIKRDFDFCSEILDEYFEPRHTEIYRRVSSLISRQKITRRTDNKRMPLLWAVILLSSAAIMLTVLLSLPKAPQRENQFYGLNVPARTITIPDNDDAPGSPPSQALINVNLADVQELCALPGIGPVLAQRIVDERTRGGLYHYPADLLSVSGIGEKTLQRLLPYIQLGE